MAASHKEKGKAKTAKRKTAAPGKRASSAEKSKGGRPSIFCDEIAEAICTRIAAGEAVVNICKDDNMPGLATIYRWLNTNERFRELYARAKDDAADTMASRIQAVADEQPERDPVIGKVDSGWVQHQRLKVDALKWCASKLKPKVYGEKVDVNHGVQPENPLNVLLQQIGGSALPVKKDSEEE